MMKTCLENLDENPCWENMFVSSKIFCVGQHAGFSCRSMTIVHYLYLHRLQFILLLFVVLATVTCSSVPVQVYLDL